MNRYHAERTAAAALHLLDAARRDAGQYLRREIADLSAAIIEHERVSTGADDEPEPLAPYPSDFTINHEAGDSWSVSPR